MPASSADSQAVRAWTPPDPLAEGEDSGYEPEWYDEGGGPVTAEPARRWAGELISPFAAGTAEAEAVPDEEEEEQQPGPFSVEGELLVWATELAQAPHQVRAAFGRQADAEAVRLLVGHGVRDEEWLTDLVFHARHHELAGRPPGPDEPALASERQAIRDDEIRPRLEGEEENFLGDIVRDGLARNAVRAALAGGEQNENKLTDLGYRAIPGVPAQIKADDPRFAELNRRWTRVRDRIVRPLLREKKAGLDRLVARSRPGLRPCCVIFGTELLDLGSLGAHGPAAGEPLGEVYTRKLGFMDLGHARETADVTLWALTQLQQNASAGTVIDLYHGSARLLREVPVDRKLALAQQLTYVDSVEHEIVTFGTIQDYSAFSPEDLPSNLFGTLVAAAAFRVDGGSDAAITQQFKQLLTAADAQPVAVARQVQVAALLRGWWATSPAIALRKRNFTAVPWLINENGTARIGHGALAAAPALVSADFEYTSGNNGMKNSEFAQKIAVIRAAVPASAVTP